MGNLGFQELFVIGVVALLVVGPKRLPDLAKAIGQAVRAFQDAMRDSAAGDEPAPRTSRDPGSPEA